MSLSPTIRDVQQALETLSAQDAGDHFQRQQVTATVRAFALARRQAINRAMSFGDAGLLAEAYSVIADFPDLLGQSLALNAMLARKDAVGALACAACDGVDAATDGEHDRLEQIVLSYQEQEGELRAYRKACIEGEGPAGMRQRIKALLRRDGGAGPWAAQLAVVEREWIDSARARLSAGLPDAEIVVLADELLQGGWAARVDAEFVRSVQERAHPLRVAAAKRRFAQIAADLEAAMARGDLDASNDLERAWAELQRASGVEPDQDTADRAAPCWAWSAEATRRREEAAAHARALEELELLLLDEAHADRVHTAWTRICDSALPVPEGLELRARRFVALHEERLARRHRMQLAGGLAALLVLGGVLAFAVVAYQRSVERARALAAVSAAIESNDGERAVALAAAISQHHAGDLTAAEEGVIAASTALRDRLAALEGRAERELARVDAALAPEAPRATVQGVEAALKGVLAQPGLSEGTKARVDMALARCAARREAIAAADDAAARAASDRADQVLREWPLPDKWSALERVDPERWSRYRAALDALAVELNAAKTSVQATDRASRRLEQEIGGVKERITECAERTELLATARKQLGSTALAAEISSEQQFVDRIKEALKGQTGAVLGDMGLRSAFEESDACDDALLALMDWRDTLRPTLLAQLGRDLEVPDDPAVAQKALVEIDAHLRRFPESPVRPGLEALRDSLDPAKRQLVTTVGDIVAALEREGIAGLAVVNLRQQGRFFYRRAGVDGGVLKGALEDASGLIEAPDKLGTARSIKADQVRGEPVPSPVSVKFEESLSRIRGARISAVVPAMSRMLMEIALVKPGDPGGDALMQLAVLANLTEIAIDGLGQPVDADRARELREWLESIRKANAGLLSLDWVKLCHTPTAISTQQRREAADLVRTFPLKIGMTLQSKAQQFGDLHSAYAPVGVMLPAEGNRGARRVVLWRPTDQALAVSMSLGRSTLVPVRIVNGTASDDGLAVSRGPVLLYGNTSKEAPR